MQVEQANGRERRPVPALTRADEAVLRRLVGPMTFMRGRLYVSSGAVKRCEWEGDDLVSGEVQGTAATPYRASVTLERSRSGRLVSLEADCTCPVGSRCKHSVALLLTPRRQHSAVHPPRAEVPATAAKGSISVPDDHPMWEQMLRPLLQDPGADGRTTGEAQVGLQFELVPGRATPTMAGRAPDADPGVCIRPVLRSPAGNWVRTGVTWDTLDHLAYSRPPVDPERIALMKELLALSRVASRRVWYGYGADRVRLETVSSRRVWDLLRQAQELGVPLLQPGRGAAPVALAASGADLVLDVTRSGVDLRMRALVATVAGDPIPGSASLLIGNPAHGVVWWDDPPASAARPGLRLAPFARPLTPAEHALLAGGPLRIPGRDAERFLGAAGSRLRRRVELRSSDGSVVLPELPAMELVLSVHHLDGHRVELAWRTGVAGGASRERLCHSLGGYDRSVEEAVASATAIASKVAKLVDPGPDGERLVPEAELAGMDAVVFVSDLMPALADIEALQIEQLGTPVDYRGATEAPVLSFGGSETRDGDWFDLSVEVSVAGEEVPFQELFVALAQERSHLILPSGTYFSLDCPQLRQLAELIAEARALNDAPDGEVRVSRFQASLWEDFGRLGALGAQAGAWEASVRALAVTTDVGEQPLPRCFDAVLRPYQQAGFRWLAFLYEHRLGGVLADDMGLGKTVQALALMCHAREQGTAEAPFLVVAPTSVVGNWAAECAKFAPDLPVVTVTETMGRRGARLAEVAAGAGLVVTSYALFRIEYDDYESISWSGLFLDEAQFAKNSSSHAYRRAKTLPVPFKVAMTGTPMENNLMELWSLLSISAPGLFASPDRFGEYYRLPIERHGDAERLSQLRRRVRPLMLRRTKEQVAADLPDKQEQVLELGLHPRHRRLYQTYLQRERQKVLGLLDDMDRNRFEIFRSLTLLRQASLDMSLVDAGHAGVPSTKLDALIPMLEEIVTDGHRVIVFSQFTRYLNLARQRIQDAGMDQCYLDGRTRKRAAVISKFRQGTAPVFLVSLKAGGFGLNLVEADYCILLDPWWNPATEAQAVDRIHRIGQTRKVMVYRMVAKDTIEEKVMALKAKKAALFASVMDAEGLGSGALTAADIRGLLD
ncbi:MAG: SNF2-related protein [Acidimicrobiales bacterium]